MIRELTVDEVNNVSGGDAMNHVFSWTGSVAGGLAGYTLANGLRGAAMGGLVGFGLGVTFGGLYYLATHH